MESNGNLTEDILADLDEPIPDACDIMMSEDNGSKDNAAVSSTTAEPTTSQTPGITNTDTQSTFEMLMSGVLDDANKSIPATEETKPSETPVDVIDLDSSVEEMAVETTKPAASVTESGPDSTTESKNETTENKKNTTDDKNESTEIQDEITAKKDETTISEPKNTPDSTDDKTDAACVKDPSDRMDVDVPLEPSANIDSEAKTNPNTEEKSKTPPVIDSDVIAIDDDDDDVPSRPAKASSNETNQPAIVPTEVEKPESDTTPMDANQNKQDEEPEQHNEAEQNSISSLQQILENIAGNLEKESEVKIDDTPKIECLNSKCHKMSSDMYPAPIVISNVYGVNQKPKKTYFICTDCYNDAIVKLESHCTAISDNKALFQLDLPIREEVVELSDDSDDEGSSTTAADDSEPPLDPQFLKFLEEELDSALKVTMEKHNVKQQVDWSVQLLQTKLKNNNKMIDEVMDEFRQLEKQAQDMHRRLYSTSEPKLLSIPGLDIYHSSDGKDYRERFELPPPGLVTRPPINMSAQYYAVRARLLSAWGSCKVVDAMEKDKTVEYKVTFIDNKNLPVKSVPGKMLAYSHPPSTRLPVGERVIALFNNEDTPANAVAALKNQFFPGVIAEPLQTYNNFRYLVFFADGYAQYVSPQDVRLVYEVSKNVWEDVHTHANVFIQEYLKNFKRERPLVQVKRGQKIVTEFKGVWHHTRVIEVDASLVKVYFDGIKRAEWIYRGSTRLGPLYREKLMTKQKAERTQHQKRNEPSVEYVMVDKEDDQHQERQNAATLAEGGRSVARKSTAPSAIVDAANKQRQMQQAAAGGQVNQQTHKVQYLNSHTIILEDDTGKGRVVYYTARQNFQIEEFKAHECSPDCLFKIQHNLKMYSPIAKPLLTGWERQIAKVRNKRSVVYRAPCGRRLRNIDELHRYLRLTECFLSIDCFNFNVNLHCLAEFVVEKPIYKNPDISEGKEIMPIPCINYFDDTKPPPMKYSAVRIPTDGVKLNLDEEFLCGCDCEDDCFDKLKCACQQLTIAGARYGNPKLSAYQVGYQYKRLHTPVPTGIYECNARCKCKKNCLNRVVQFPLQNKLHVYKTNNRGWGLRAINDIPAGTFICNYTGFLLTEEMANENGADHGDEYFADLDYIEIAEQTKEGYESDAPEMSDESDEYNPEEDRNDDEDFVTSTARPVTRSTRSTRNTEMQMAKKRKPTGNGNGTSSHRSTPTTPVPSSSANASDDEEDRERISLMPTVKPLDEAQVVKTRGLRQLYGKDETVYVMDAKISGNIGRYFNHSCDPNMFVQNVFVDTHDLRFPWIAFFSSRYIRAGTELTWNYNYDVGSVPGKVLFCQCGASNCRQRLL